jgi:capsular polysaccharide biosynthesis protein
MVPTVFSSVVYVTAIRSRTMDRYPGPFFALRDALLEHAATDASAPRRLWMERNLGVLNAPRDLVNAAEVYALLGRYGFEIVDMASLPLVRQLALANGAAVLGGVHGAGFVHTMFMPHGSTVIECFSPEFVNTNWFGLLNAMRHRYFMIVNRSAYQPYAYGARVMVDCAHLELTLRTLQAPR